MRRLEKPNWKRKKERRRFFLLAGILLAAFVSAVSAGIYFFRPSSPFSETKVLANGDKLHVRAGGDFQAALDRAKPGDTILLQAGAEFRGNFVLPKKTESGGGAEKFITVRTSAEDAKLPPAGKRLDPKIFVAVLPKLKSETVEPVLRTENGSNHFRFIGVEFRGTKNGENNIIQIGSTEEKNISEIPHRIEFDRVFIHADSPEGQRRGIAANGRFIVIKNSHISGIRRKGDESQAIAVWATDGPVEIINNYLEAAAENILFGGGGSPLKLVPTGCVVRDNHLNKPLAWKNEGWVVKNLFEIKNGKNIRVENNLMTNNWASGQDGTAILFTVREDNGRASIIEDVIFTNNIVRGSGNAVNILGSEGGGGRRLTIKNNLFADIDGRKWGGAGHFLIGTDWSGLVIENNTIIQTGNITNAYGAPLKNFVFRDNIIFQNEYGMIGDGVGPGKPTIGKFFPGARIENNIIIGGNASLYGSGNFYPASVRQIGFLDFENYRLASDNPYRKRGFEGGTIGAELNFAKIGGN